MDLDNIPFLLSFCHQYWKAWILKANKEHIKGKRNKEGKESMDSALQTSIEQG